GGHVTGGRTTREAAATIRRCLPARAWAVAYAGDEFVVVLPGAHRDAAVAKADEIRRSIRDTPYLVTTGKPAHLTASFGVATFPDDARDLTELLGLAAQSLFTVKKSGRDDIATERAPATPPARPP